MTRIVWAIIFIFSFMARADQTVTLYPGQCVNISGQEYCWQYRPTYIDHPDLPPQRCDFSKTCPITYIIPDKPKVVNKLGTYVGAPTKKEVDIIRLCKGYKEDKDYKLVQIQVKDEKKIETVLNEYGDDRARCERDAANYSVDARYGNSVIVDNYRVPAGCNGKKRKVYWKDVKKSFKDIFN